MILFLIPCLVIIVLTQQQGRNYRIMVTNSLKMKKKPGREDILVTPRLIPRFFVQTCKVNVYLYSLFLLQPILNSIFLFLRELPLFLRKI